MEKLFYSIGEVAEILEESVSLVRFWCNSFPKLLKPHRNAKGNRLFTAEDVQILKQIHLLVKEKGMTLEGAEKVLSGERSKVEGNVRALDSLKAIRAQLVQIKETL